MPWHVWEYFLLHVDTLWNVDNKELDFTKYDALALPSAQVFPFNVETNWPNKINDVEMSTYHIKIGTYFLKFMV